MGQKDTDFQKIKKLIKIMKDNDLVEVEIKHDDEKIVLKRSVGQQPVITTVPVISHNITGAGVGLAESQNTSPETESKVAEKEEEVVEITSPLVGTFYATPSPDSEAYVEIGSHVTAQTIVCIIEAMKVMNEIKAETSGTITKILVKSGQAVEFGQVLFKVKPD